MKLMSEDGLSNEKRATLHAVHIHGKDGKTDTEEELPIMDPVLQYYDTIRTLYLQGQADEDGGLDLLGQMYKAASTKDGLIGVSKDEVMVPHVVRKHWS